MSNRDNVTYIITSTAKEHSDYQKYVTRDADRRGWKAVLIALPFILTACWYLQL